jgi:hypothetical protein
MVLRLNGSFTESSYLMKSMIQVFSQIVGIFQSHRYTDQGIRYSNLLPYLSGNGSVGHLRQMLNQRLHTTQTLRESNAVITLWRVRRHLRESDDHLSPRAFIKFFFPSLILSGMVVIHRYPFTAALIAMFCLFNFSSENGISINCISEYHWQSDRYSPKGKI